MMCSFVAGGGADHKNESSHSLQVQELCRLVSIRGARVIAASLSAVIKHMGRDKEGIRTVIAVDGGVFEAYTQHRWGLAHHARHIHELTRVVQGHTNSVHV